MPTVESYLEFWASLNEPDRMAFTEEALSIARSEGLGLANADVWDTLGWVFADGARNQSDTASATTGVCLAAAMFSMAETLRNPPGTPRLPLQ